jgi:hypothetical protein
MKHPDVLAWEYLWPKTVNQLHRKIYDTVKSVKPNAHIGRHVDHQQSSYALLFRAAADYGEMTEANDFIKMILYHDIAGPRVLNKMANIRKHVLRELNEELSLRLYYALFGYDPAKEAGLDQIVEKGLSPYYVQREVERAVKQVNGGAAIYAGIGMDIPKGGGWGDEKWVSDPEEIHLAVKLAFGAGAKGVVASREYEEITVGSLQAMGKAVKEYRSL